MVVLLAANRSWLSCFSRPEKNKISRSLFFWDLGCGSFVNPGSRANQTNPSCGVVGVRVGDPSPGVGANKSPSGRHWSGTMAVQWCRCCSLWTSEPRDWHASRKPPCRMKSLFSRLGHCHPRTCSTGVWSAHSWAQFVETITRSVWQRPATRSYKASSCSAICTTSTNWRWRHTQSSCPFIHEVFVFMAKGPAL